MDKEMLSFETRGKARYYNFHCPACDAAGELGLADDESGQFCCPEECGACFIEYKSDKGWAIRCVVQPVYSDDMDEQSAPEKDQ